MLISKLKQWFVSFIIMQTTPTGYTAGLKRVLKAYKSTQCTVHKVRQDAARPPSPNQPKLESDVIY